MNLILSYYIAFKRKPQSSCSGKIIEGYTSIYDAYKSCKKDNSCTGFFDASCDGNLFWTCGGKIELNSKLMSTSPCSWEKGNDQNI